LQFAICNRTIRRGFSLIELSVGLFASSFLIIGISGSVFMATQANRTDIGPFRNSNAAASALDDAGRELAYATALRSVTANRSIEVEIPDRTGDNVNDVVKYQWSGTAGAPLQRIFNNGTATNTITSLQSFALATTTETKTNQGLGAVTLTSGDIAWYADTSASLESTYNIDASSGIGTDYLPSLPDGTTTWSINRVDVKCNRTGTTDGIVKVRIWTADSSWKPNTMLAEQSVNEASLASSAGWYTVLFSPAPTLAASQRACVTVQYASGTGTAMQIRYDALADLWSQGSIWKMTTANGGSSWSQSSTQKLLIQIRGFYTYPGIGIVDITNTSLTGVLLEAQAGTDFNARMRSAVRTRNKPAVTP
jgi:hypothetical protein